MYFQAHSERQGYILHLQKSRFSQVPQQESRRREFVVDSGASMRMVRKKDFDSAELETMRTSRRSPTTVMTANGEVQTREEATENVKQFIRQCYAS